MLAAYAAYAVEHGLADLVGRQVTVEQISQLLREGDEGYRREQPAEGWPSYYARLIVARLQ